MRRAILLRHAKSSWADPGQQDIDRPLNPRGLRSAAAVGGWLAGQGLLPQAALVSSALRTRQTWAQLGPAFAATPASFRPELYHAEAETLLHALREAPPAAGTVMLVGHQPGIGEAVARLLAKVPDDPDLLRYPTAAVAVIDFDTGDWSGIDWAQGHLHAFSTPRRLE